MGHLVGNASFPVLPVDGMSLAEVIYWGQPSPVLMPSGSQVSNRLPVPPCPVPTPSALPQPALGLACPKKGVPQAPAQGSHRDPVGKPIGYWNEDSSSEKNKVKSKPYILLSQQVHFCQNVTCQFQCLQLTNF